MFHRRDGGQERPDGAGDPEREMDLVVNLKPPYATMGLSIKLMACDVLGKRCQEGRVVTRDKRRLTWHFHFETDAKPGCSWRRM
jgi:hypothetical protein